MLPKSAHPGALAALKDIYNAEDIAKARAGDQGLRARLRQRSTAKAVAKIADDADVLLEFYKYPRRAFRVRLRTTNPIESTCATVAPAHQGHQSAPAHEAAGIAMAYKLISTVLTISPEQFVIPTMSRPGEGACFPPRTRGLLVATAPAFRAPVRSR